jgi:hypothetical protein
MESRCEGLTIEGFDLWVKVIERAELEDGEVEEQVEN